MSPSLVFSDRRVILPILKVILSLPMIASC